MPAPQLSDLGPLGALAGIWEGSKGLDVSFHNAEGEVADTPYRERVVMNAFGPVDNGEQQLFGLDYRMAAWRGSEEDPFHTEVGYWLWDATNKQVMRCFMVPRGSVLIAGATVEPDARTFTLAAVDGAPDYAPPRRFIGDGNLDQIISAPCAGHFRSDVELLQPVTAGQRLGVIFNLIGEPLAEVRADRDGVVITLRALHRVNAGDGLVHLTQPQGDNTP
jgi:hypothetical protein